VLCSVCWFLCGPFCHGALKPDISSLFTTFFSLNISSIYITGVYINVACLVYRKGADYVLKAVADESTAHIQKLVSKQKGKTLKVGQFWMG